MEDKKAQKLIGKILQDLNQNGIIINTLTDDLKELREFARKEQNPLLVKLLRLTYEHIGAYETFHIEIPKDEPIEDEEKEEEGVEITSKETSENSEENITDNQEDTTDALIEEDEIPHDPVESLLYMISLFKDPSNRINVQDLKTYRTALLEF